ncbi:hypothetical protein Hanom_Chr06g00518271 [Helianthus anomalus]
MNLWSPCASFSSHSFASWGFDNAFTSLSDNFFISSGCVIPFVRFARASAIEATAASRFS